MDENILLECDIKIEEEEIHGDWNDDNSTGAPKINKTTSNKNDNRRRGKSKSKNTWSNYLKHQARLQLFRCTYCTFETSWKCYLKSHVKKIHGPPETTPMYKCLQCDFQTKWRFSLVNHMKVHCPPEALIMYKCPHCSYESKWNNGLTSHMKVHIYPKIIKFHQCEKCSYKTRNKIDLAAHIKLVHEPPLPKFKCPLCPFETTHRHGVNKHLKVHNGLKH